MKRFLFFLVVVLVLAAPANANAALYGVGTHKNVPVKLSDGTVLRADVLYPTDPKTGEAASGKFPVLMVQTPYGKDLLGRASGREGGAEAGGQTGPVPFFVKRGYIDVVVDVRGSGASQGTFNLMDPQQGKDGAEVVRWAAKLPNSNGRVGLYGSSYMGSTQFMTVQNLGPNSPVKAIFPIITPNSPYRDLAFSGGMPSLPFDIGYAVLLGSLNTAGPVAGANGDLVDLVRTELQHARGVNEWQISQVLNIASGGDQAYDEAYWQARSPRNMLAKAVRSGVPAFLVGGWFDVFQRGELLNFSGLQNAHRGRSVAKPMRAKQRVTGRYQLLQGPWYHLTAGGGVDIYKLELAWFDRWLKGIRNGIDETSRPLHLFALGARRWVDTSRYPLNEAKPRTLYLADGPSGSGAPSRNDGRLTPVRPRSGSGADRLDFIGAGSPCSLQSDQFGTGPINLLIETAELPASPCAEDDRTIQTGPGALTYTTSPMNIDTVIGGPIAATIYATSTRPEVELVATLEDVAPGGKSTPVTSGALLGSFRAVDGNQSWSSRDGRFLMPHHPYTRASAMPVEAGKQTRYDIEIFPTFLQLRKGHRLRFTLTSSDPGHSSPTPGQLKNLVGGVYQVQRNARGASYLNVPMADASSFGHCFAYTPGSSEIDCDQAASARVCLSRRSPIGPRNIGGVRIGYSRRRLLRGLRVRPIKRTRHAYRYCVRGRSGRVTAVFSRRSRRGRAVLVTTTARGHGNRGVRVRSKASKFRSAYPDRRRIHRGLYRASRTSTRLIGVRRGRVRFIAVAKRSLLNDRAALRRALRRAAL